jgi:hypothetical protein
VRVNDGQTTTIAFKLSVRLGQSIDVRGTRTPIHKDGS